MKHASLLCLFVTQLTYIHGDYWSDRDAFLASEASQVIGSSIVLTDKEQQVNDILMNFKLQELDEALADPSTFLPSIHFFDAKYAIEKSEVFKIIKQLPKMGSLHSHFSAMVDTDFIVKNLTYFDNLYGCDYQATLIVKFFFDEPDDQCNWKLLSDYRYSDANFNNQLRFWMSLETTNPEAIFPDIDSVWRRFEGIFGVVEAIITYRPALRLYLLELFREFHDDNVMYLEIRDSLLPTFDENGTIHDAASNIQFYIDTLAEFRNTYPDFIGFLLIYSVGRHVDNETMENKILQYLELKQQFPDVVVGFDLVGQEDKGYRLSDFADQLLEISNQTNFVFHAGETNWNGETDLNLIDAVLLDTVRIGHGFAVLKHPDVLQTIKDKNIAIEVNPLSNQVLKLVSDLRNHVGTYLIANGFPIVISCDDPSFWGATGLSYDWYMAFIGMTPRNGDLRILKQLALNSINYSLIDETSKPYVRALFDGRWNDFLDTIILNYA